MPRKPSEPNDATARFETFDAMPPAPPLNAAFQALSDGDVERRAAADPDAGTIPPGFWDRAVAVNPDAELPGKGEPVTLRVDPEVLRWFRSLGTDYRSRMNAVLILDPLDQSGSSMSEPARRLSDAKSAIPKGSNGFGMTSYVQEQQKAG